MSTRESLNESITDDPDSAPANTKSLKRYRVAMYVCGACTLLFTVLACISALVLGKLIDSQARKGVVMTRENEDIWAHVPGSTETIVIRNYTFFNFTNPKEVLYRNAKPVFRQVSGYLYQQLIDLVDTRYVDDGNVVEFNYWLHFQERDDSRDTNQKVKVLNVGPLGFWGQVKVLPDENFTLSAFGALFLALRDTLKTGVLGQGVWAQYLPNYQSYRVLGETAQLSNQTAQFLWEDKLYGLGNPANSDLWIEAAKAGIGSNQSNHLQNYFYLSSVQIQNILLKLNDWSESVDIIIGNWYCGSSDCSSQRMAYMQLSHSGITKNPPLGSDPIQSICSMNVSCIGHPQIDNYLQYVFKKEYPDRKECFNVTFTEEEFRKLFQPSSKPYCLLHSGNLHKLFQHGRLYDESGSEEALERIRVMFELDSEQKTFVFWNWVKYFTYQFALKTSRHGTKSIAGVGGVAAMALYQSISSSSGWLLETMLSSKVAALMKSQFQNCDNFLNQTIDNISQDQIKNICSAVNLSKPSTLVPLINTCRYLYSKTWQQTQTNASLSKMQMNQLCDQEQASVTTLIEAAQKDLQTFYDCSFTPEIGCSDFEIGYKQWNQSLITINPIPELNYSSAWTVNEWNSQISTFEYSYYLFYMESTSSYRPNLTEVVDLLSFDRFYNPLMIQQLWLVDDEKFKEWFYWPDRELLKEYLRFVAIEVGFAGLTQERSPQQLIFGYDDPFIKQLIDIDPLMGGDPSMSSIIALNQPNLTRQEAQLYPQAMFTGKNDSSLTRLYAYVNGKTYTTINYSYWNGDEVVKSIRSPWPEQDHFLGTDAVQVPPGIDVSDPDPNMHIFITSICRYGNAVYNKTTQKHDMDLVEAKIPHSLFMSQYQRQQNRIYYQQYDGFTNQTAVVGLPLFISKNHFLDAPSNWSELIDLYDQEGNKLTASEHDDTYLLLEPTTGACLSARMYLQSNYYFKQDELFSRNGTLMLPIFTIWRSGNISNNAVEKYFGVLRTGLKIKKKVTFLMIAAAGLCLIFTLVLVVKLRRQKRFHQKSPSLITVDE